jgi:hypothetical protein
MTIDAQAAIENEDDDMQWYIIILKLKFLISLLKCKTIVNFVTIIFRDKLFCILT